MAVPAGYKKLPAGVRCRCIKLHQEGDDFYCCHSARTARQALHELHDYFEQKRNLAIRTASQLGATTPVLKMEADCYDHAMEMVATYIRANGRRSSWQRWCGPVAKR